MRPLARSRPRRPGDAARRDLLLGLFVLALVAVGGYLSTVAISGGPFDDPYDVRVQLPADAPVLKDGDEVRIAGQRAGEVRRVKSGRDGGALATLALDDGPVGRDATVRIRQRGLGGAVYLELSPGDRGAAELPDGGLLARGAGSGAVELTDVVEAFDADTRAALRTSLRAVGPGLAGRGGDVNATIADLAPAAADGAPLLRALRPTGGALAQLTARADRVLAAASVSGDLGPLVTAARRTVGALDARRPAISAALRELPPLEAEIARTLPVADPLLDDLAVTARALGPATASLHRSLPDLNGVLARASGLTSLARVGRIAAPVLDRARPLLRELRAPALSLVPVADALGPLASYLAPYRREILEAPTGFTRWGNFRYAEGQASGSRAVRFSMILTCHRARDAYPAPGAAEGEVAPCR